MPTPASILSYGIIGLGFLLAGLAFRLLNKEQNKKTPSQIIVRSIYAFEVFCIVLVILGGTNEYVKSDTRWHNSELVARVSALTDELAALQNTNLTLSQQIERLRNRKTEQKWLKIIGLNGLNGTPVRIIAWVNDVAYSYPNTVT